MSAGMDDYLSKPFGMGELVARVQAALRRSRLEGVPQRVDSIEVDGLRIDADLMRAYLVAADGERHDAHLTPTEFRLLLVLAQNVGRAMSRDELQQRVWNVPYRPLDRSVDVCVRKVREKLDRRSHGWDYVHTHYGVGYRFAAEPHGGGGTAAAGDTVPDQPAA